MVHTAKNIFIIPFFIAKQKGYFSLWPFIVTLFCALVIKKQRHAALPIFTDVLSTSPEVSENQEVQHRSWYVLIASLIHFIIIILGIIGTIRYVEQSICPLYIPGTDPGMFGHAIMMFVVIISIFSLTLHNILFFILVLMVMLWFFGNTIVYFDDLQKGEFLHHFYLALAATTFPTKITQIKSILRGLPFLFFLCTEEQFFTNERGEYREGWSSYVLRIVFSFLLCFFLILLFSSHSFFSFVIEKKTLSEALLYAFFSKAIIIHLLNSFFLIAATVVVYFAFNYANKFLRYTVAPLVIKRDLPEMIGFVTVFFMVSMVKKYGDPLFIIGATTILSCFTALIATGINVVSHRTPLQKFFQLISVGANILLIIAVMMQLL